MKLSDYLKTNKITARDLADRLGVSVKAVNKWKRHERVPRPRHLVAIAAETNGAVTVGDFIMPEESAA